MDAEQLKRYEKSIHVCVECGKSKQSLIKKYSESVKVLTICDAKPDGCKRLVDKYIEYDYTILFMDLILMKITAYRHVLFNIPDKGKLLLRMILLTIIATSYAEWVFENQPRENVGDVEQPLTDKIGPPIFYELEWGFYSVLLSQAARAFIFILVFVICCLMFLLWLYPGRYTPQTTDTDDSPFQCLLESAIISYNWNFVSVLSLVWNFYDLFYVIGRFAVFCSCMLTVRCIQPKESPKSHVILSIIIFALGSILQWGIGRRVRLIYAIDIPDA